MTVVEAFFSLIRLAIGTSESADLQLDEASWNKVFVLSKKQALTAIVFDGVCRLPERLRPPVSVLLPWIGLVAKIEQANKRLNIAAVNLSQRLSGEGFRGALLKGQGIAMLYPNPLHRTPGDIDFWVDASREMVVAYVRKYFSHTEVVYHHAAFPILKEFEVELHTTPSWMYRLRINLRLQRFFDEWRSKVMLNFVELPHGSGKIAVPLIGMNRIFILVHIYRHLFDEGIGLRQLLDYFYVLSLEQTEDERVLFLQTLRRLHLFRFARAVMYVLGVVFDMPSDRMPIDPDEKRGRRLLDEIMAGGNFGQYNQNRSASFNESRFKRFRRRVWRNTMFLKDYPGEVLWCPVFKVWHFIWRAGHGYLGERS